jgi:cell division protein FtsB
MMSFVQSLKRKARAAVPPVLFLLLVAYFLWQATQGEHGLREYAQRQQDLIAAQAELGRANAELASWERHVSSLRDDHIDPDALDERARAMLNLSDPNDLTVLYGNGKKLF